MNQLSCCPYCQGDFVIKEVECQNCATQIKGNFYANRFHLFNAEDLHFIELFLKNEGNIKLMEKDLSVSYPTIKSRLKAITKILGYQETETQSQSRLKILNDLSEGATDLKDTLKKLQDLK